MTKNILIFALAAVMISPLSAKDTMPVPPSIDSTDNVTPATAQKKVTEQAPEAKKKKSVVTDKQLSEEELAQARKDLDAAKVRSKNPSLWPKTKIEETVDNHNVVTEVKVTPMSTQIPYTMTREHDSTMSSSDATGSKNKMSVPKFIKFGF